MALRPKIRNGGRQISQPNDKKYLHGEGVCPQGYTWDGTTCAPLYESAMACTKDVTQCWYPAEWHDCGYYSPYYGDAVCQDCTLTLDGEKPYHDASHPDCCVKTQQHIDQWPWHTSGFTGDACNYDGPFSQDPCRSNLGGSGGSCHMGFGCCYYEGGELAGGSGDDSIRRRRGHKRKRPIRKKRYGF
tara:strand:- start:453 stop:1013 length:561 start_codon:yes stop_codon:yes gene_type:complete